MASEIIREKLIRLLGEELPYSVAVKIENFVINERNVLIIRGVILVERQGQKKIVIGSQGSKIKAIACKARCDMEKLFSMKVHLTLWVKVKSSWSNDKNTLSLLGYDI